MIGPNQAATCAVPLLCMKNSPMMMIMQRGRMKEIERRGDELQTFHGGENGNCRRDDCVAIKQRRSGHSKQGNHKKVAAHRALQERHQAQRSAFAMVVGAHDQPYVFQGHDDRQSPEHERHHADHHAFSELSAGGSSRQTLLQRVKGTGANVAVDDADGTQRQRPDAAARLRRANRGILSRSALRHCRFRGFRFQEHNVFTT